MILIIGVGIIMLGIGLFLGRIITDKPDKRLNNINERVNYNDSLIEPKQTKQDNFIQRMVKNFQDKQHQKRLQKQKMEKIKIQAREEALKQMQPELVKYMINEERKKLTGEDKKEKLEKFANMFSMKGTGLGSTEKINSMLGGQQYVQPQPQQGYHPNQSYGYNQPGGATNQPPQNRQYKYKNKSKKKKSRNTKRPRQYQQQPQQQSDPFSTERLNGMMGLGNQNNHNTGMNMNVGNSFSDDKIDMILGKRNNKQSNNKMQNFDDKMKEFLR